MNLEIQNPKEFEKLITLASKILTEAVLVVDEAGLLIRAMDPARVAMVSLQFPAEYFRTFEISEPMKYGLALEPVSTWLKKAKTEELLVIDDDKLPELTFEYQNAYTRAIQFPTLDLEHEDVPIPQLELAVQARIDAKIFKEIIDNALLVDDHIEIQATSAELTFHSGRESGHYQSQLETDMEHLVIELYSAEGAIQKSVYTLRYLKDLVVSTLTSEIDIAFSQNMPLSLRYQGEYTLQVFLAPRIEEG